MRKQLKLSSQPLMLQPETQLKEPLTQIQEKEPKKKPLQSSFFERLRDEVNKYEYVKNNEYFKLNFDIEKMKTFSKAWDMYRKLKAKAHEVVQSGFEMYKNCSKKQIDSSLEAVISTYNSIKQKEDNQIIHKNNNKNNNINNGINSIDASDPPSPSPPPPPLQAVLPQPKQQSQSQQPSDNIPWRVNKSVEQEKLDHKQINEIYLILFFGLQLRSLCDWLYTNLNDASKNQSTSVQVNQEEQLLSKQRHEYFNETIPSFIKKTKQKIYYSDLCNQDKKLVDKISKGYEPQSK